MTQAEALLAVRDALDVFLDAQLARGVILLRNHGASDDEVRTMLDIQRCDYEQMMRNLLIELPAWLAKDEHTTLN